MFITVFTRAPPAEQVALEVTLKNFIWKRFGSNIGLATGSPD
jgi:hypothetical protein